MPKINNTAVIQKLIKELNLYPGADSIPTELAEKIVPVFQVNSDEVFVQTPTANIVRFAKDNSGSDETIYAVPATGKFYLTNVHLSTSADADLSTNVKVIVKVTIAGVVQQLLTVEHDPLETAIASNVHNTVLNLQNPILVDPSTNITVISHADVVASVNIVGYTAN